MSVEDIERNIRNQQIQKTEQSKQQQQQTTAQHQQQNEQQSPFPPGIVPPPGLTPNKNSIFPPHVQSQQQQQQQRPNVIGGPVQKPGTSRVPPGFQLNMLPPHMNAQQATQLRQNVANMLNMPPHPMNNFPVSIFDP